MCRIMQTCHDKPRDLTEIELPRVFMIEERNTKTYVNKIQIRIVVLTGILTGLVLSSNGICLNTQLAVKVNIFSFANFGVLKF